MPMTSQQTHRQRTNIYNSVTKQKRQSHSSFLLRFRSSYPSSRFLFDFWLIIYEEIDTRNWSLFECIYIDWCVTLLRMENNNALFVDNKIRRCSYDTFFRLKKYSCAHIIMSSHSSDMECMCVMCFSLQCILIRYTNKHPWTLIISPRAIMNVFLLAWR